MEMDKDIIDFNAINIKTKTIPFKTQNSILRWRTAVFVLISIFILIIFCLILKSTNTSYNKKHNLYEEISTNSTAIQSELDELNKEINEEKEKYQNLINENNKLKKEYFELGGK